MSDKIIESRTSKQFVTDAPVEGNSAPSAGLSPHSGGSNESETMEESALQHLNIDYENDSAIGGMTPQTSTMSVNSSIYQFVEENGRTYHRYKEGTYFLPNDEAEMERLDLQHQLWMLTLHDEMHLSPVKNPRQVLDIGTGTGIWAIEFANRFPSVNVVGTDLSPIQPEFIPSNCSFEVDDLEDQWNFPQKFDLVHGRAMVTCFKDPATVFKSAYDSLEPGGYFELQDMAIPMRAIDDTLKGTAMEFWADTTMSAAEKLGRSWKNVEKHFQWPMNPWAKGKHLKILATYWMEDMLRALEGLSMAVLTRAGGMTKEEVETLTAKVRKDIVNKNIHAYQPVLVVYGRKPE
ncbi:hypothetical protein IFR04_013187 [Cadophora malorum]|uniref:S-adenosyl-L-methionine-dependent methyltransferase n=1 Tax=Cadophora malorum TaxID=108018 RepID=A0A8H7W636_9HELO|nr:hypothetical protein IFR04_013187 [Cadophora malorum]